MPRLKTFLRLKVTFCIGIASNERQCNDLRDTNALAHRLDERLIAFRHHSAAIIPVIQLVIDWVDNLGRIVPQHNQGTRNRRHVDRLPVTV